MYKIIFDKGAMKHFLKVDKSTQKKIISRLDKISKYSDPEMFGKPLLGNKKGLWRFRVENYRVICQIKQKELIILVLDVGHRKNNLHHFP